MVEDSSGRAERLGIRVHVVSSGRWKGLGVPGTPVTNDQLAAEQEFIDGLAAHFVTAVAEGRHMKPEDVQALADGRTWMALQAQANGLIDQVESWDAFIGRIATEIQPKTRSNGFRSVALAKRRMAL